jgi:NAD(P)-dependent dehydrogenase (short-subunit alcohol dehydrogenase family)
LSSGADFWVPRPAGIVPTDRRAELRKRKGSSGVAREGAKVRCADVNQNAANETVEIIRQENGTANAICADVTSHDDFRGMVKACTDIYGRIDVIDYKVGLAHVVGVVEFPEGKWDRIFAVNLKGCLLTMKHVIPIREK